MPLGNPNARHSLPVKHRKIETTRLARCSFLASSRFLSSSYHTLTLIEQPEQSREGLWDVGARLVESVQCWSRNRLGLADDLGQIRLR